MQDPGFEFVHQQFIDQQGQIARCTNAAVRQREQHDEHAVAVRFVFAWMTVDAKRYEQGVGRVPGFAGLPRVIGGMVNVQCAIGPAA